MKVWLDGHVVNQEKARIAPSDRGFTLGDGLFETLLLKDGALHHLEAHLHRMFDGARVLGLAVPETDFAAAMLEVAQANGLSTAAIRLTLSRGSGPRGLLPPPDGRPTCLITAAPYGVLPPAHAIIARSTRRNEHSPLSRIKSLNYLDNIIARQEAEGRGANEALLLNTAGRVSEATIANVFIRRGSHVVTPPVNEGALPGVMRAEMLRSGGEERPLGIEDILAADEVFLTSSLGIRPVARVEGRSFTDHAAASDLQARLIGGGT